MLIFRAGAMGQIPEISVSLSQVRRFCGTRLTASVPMTGVQAARPRIYLLNFRKTCPQLHPQGR